MKIIVRLGVLVAVAFGISACEGNSLSTTGKGAVGGTLLGAGLGAIVGHEVGSTGAGIAIGSAIGALGGGAVGSAVEKNEQQLDQTDRRIEEQDRLIEENRRLIEDLRRQGADVRSTDRGVVINLPDVLFEFDKARLTPDAKRTAQQIADVLKGVTDRTISVEGHTDSVGTISYNQRLSEDRAHEVAGELVYQGVPRARVHSRGYGETNPIASNDTESGRQRNRRVEVIVENR